MQAMILWLMVMLAPSLAWSHEPGKPEPAMLTVSANGTVSAPPDTAFVSLGMETAGRSLAEAQRQNSAVMQRVMDRLRDLKIDKERIQTTSFNVVPQYRPPSKRSGDAPLVPEIVGYTVSNQLSVEVRELEKVAAVIDEALTAGANHFQGLQWGLRDESAKRLSALTLAAAKAREKAAVLSQALNVKLVRVLTVSEGGHVVRPAAYLGRAMAAMDAAPEVPVSSGELKVEATVTLVYEIAQE